MFELKKTFKIKYFFTFIFGLIIFLILYSCNPNTTKSKDLTINLIWHQSCEEETKAKVETGFKWILSYLGATLPKGSFENAVEWKTDKVFELNLNKVGFNKNAMKVFAKLVPKFKASEEYEINGGMDLGRFELLTFNSTWHYYEITGVEKTLDAFKKKYEFDNPIYLNKGESGVAKGERVIYLSKINDDLTKIAHMAIEGTGKRKNNSFEPKDYEVYDYMLNGQPRFAIYDEEGYLKKAGDPKISIAGKPAKCMWCHESNIQPSFKRKMTKKLEAFNLNIYPRREKLFELQRAIQSEISFDSLAHHRDGEFPFASYKESSLYKLSKEFSFDTIEIKQFVKNLEKHTTPHFPEFGFYYDRKDVKFFEKYKSIETPTDMWEFSEYEPNLLK